MLISTGDKDLAQLVNDQVTLINTMAKPPEMLDVEGVKAKFGVPPERIVDYLTLVGDTVDNVPGVDKVGPKTAVKWIAEYGSLDGVVAAAADIKGAVGDNLRKALDWLPTGRKLVTVLTDCDLSATCPAGRRWTRWRCARWTAGAARLLRALRLPQLAARAGAGAGRRRAAAGPRRRRRRRSAAAAATLAREYETVIDLGALRALAAQIAAAELVALDTETDSLDAMRAQHRRHLLRRRARPRRLRAAAHDYPGAPEQLPLRRGAGAADALAGGRGARQAGPEHQVRHPCASPTHGIAVRGYVHDTLLQSYVLEAHKPHGLESLAERHLRPQGPELRGPVRQGRATRSRSRRWTWTRPPNTPAKTAR